MISFGILGPLGPFRMVKRMIDRNRSGSKSPKLSPAILHPEIGPIR